jgi:hypothetical protein
MSDLVNHVNSLHWKTMPPALPLKPMVIEAPFQQWGLDFIGEFKDNSSNGYRWVLTTTDYFTQWVESIPTKKETK